MNIAPAKPVFGTDSENYAHFDPERPVEEGLSEFQQLTGQHFHYGLTRQQLGVRMLLWAHDQVYPNAVLTERYLATDSGRRWSGVYCCYEDMNTFEVAHPLTDSGWREPCARALGFERHYLSALQEFLERKHGLKVVVFNTDSLNESASIGAHCNMLVPRAFYEALVSDTAPIIPLLWVSELASRLFLGNGAIWTLADGRCVFLRCGRTPFLTQYRSLCTTQDRGAINTRDESLDPHPAYYARYHDVAGPHVRTPASWASLYVSLLFRTGLVQFFQYGLPLPEKHLARLLLRAPVTSARRWNTGFPGGSYRQEEADASNRPITQLELRKHVLDFVADVERMGLVPAQPAREVIDIEWRMMRKLEEGGVAALQGYTLYGLKWAALRLSGIRSLADPTAKSLLMNFDRTDAASAFWRVGWDKGLIERLGLDNRGLAAASTHAPAGRPAWRSAFVRHFPEQLVRLDWHYVEVRIDDAAYRLDLPADPQWYAGREHLLARMPEDPVAVLLEMGARRTTAPHDQGSRWDARGDAGPADDAAGVTSTSSVPEERMAGPDGRPDGPVSAPQNPVTEN